MPSRGMGRDSVGLLHPVRFRKKSVEPEALLSETALGEISFAAKRKILLYDNMLLKFCKKLLVEFMLFLKGLLQFLALQEENCMLL
jgi:hypothetical protein